jgi:methionyl-tRNA formyltransferase
MKIVFMGTPRAAVPSLDRLVSDGHDIKAVYTQPDRPAGRGKRLTLSPVKEHAIAKGLKVFQPTKLRTPEALEQFRGHGADAAVIVAYGRILPPGFLTAYTMGCINVHFSLLPRYRGAAPVNWAIARGETETGVTTMQMDEGLDTGDILMQSRTKIFPDETALELTERLSLDGAELLSKTLLNWKQIEAMPQDDADASLAPILKKEDGLIDWGLPASNIANRVRGFQPFPTAFTYLRAVRLTIWRAHAVTPDQGGNAGEVLKAKVDELLVACGGGTALAITELQLEGKRRLATHDLLNGISLRSGEILGRHE